MNRIEPVQAPFDPEVQAAFDAITPAGQTPLLLFRTIAVSRRIYARFRAGGLLDRGALSLRQREIVVLRICGLHRCEYEWGVHVSVFAAKAGFTPEQLAATVDGLPANWAAAEAALFAACEELDRTTRLGDETWALLRAHFDAPQVLEMIALAGFYRTVCLYANGLRLPLEPFAARFSACPAPRPDLPASATGPA
jgi:alkylhydroperoxidase family enzyme